MFDSNNYLGFIQVAHLKLQARHEEELHVEENMFPI